MHWLIQSKRNSKIASILSSKPRTVQKHVQNSFNKLGVKTRTAAALLALQVHRSFANYRILILAISLLIAITAEAQTSLEWCEIGPPHPPSNYRPLSFGFRNQRAASPQRWVEREKVIRPFSSALTLGPAPIQFVMV